MCDNHVLQYLIEPYSFSSGTLLNLQFTILCTSGDIPILFEDGTGFFNVQNGKITVAECISDSDCDGILNSEDNCPHIANPNQEDGDADGVGDSCDNCPSEPNPDQADADGDCIGDACDAFPTTFDPTQRDTDGDGIGDICDNAPYVYNPDQINSDSDYICDSIDNCSEQYNPCQEDTYPPGGNGIGDACECEGNFDCDQDCDGSDAATFKADFGRSTYNRPCTNADPCNGDFICDVDVDGSDAAVFKKDFGRSQYFNPCLSCAEGKWCCY
jgi:hypothetical protein